jgi:hypothetical protein
LSIGDPDRIGPGFFVCRLGSTRRASAGGDGTAAILAAGQLPAGRNRHGAGMRVRAARRAVEFPREILAAPDGTPLAR